MSVPRISRRTLLRGLGAAIALPLLDAMPAASLWAEEGAKSLPRRMGFVFVPNGMHMPAWTPELAGDDFVLPSILEPLAKQRQYLTLLSGLAQDKARSHGDGGGDHARSMSTFLTGCQARKTNGADIKIGVSVDQIAAERIGERTQLPSLEIGCAQGSQSGNCDSGYSCAYSSNLSWRSENTPMPKEINPRLVFERMFGGGQDAKGRARRAHYQNSVLDFVVEDSQRLQKQVGAKDRRKLDEYFHSLREVEKRIQRAELQKQRELPDYAAPAGIPKTYVEHIRLMYDLMALAYQADVTRVATFALDNEGSTRSYSFINVPEGHHDLSHHGRDPNKQEKIRQINRFHMEQFAYFVDKLASTPEGPGTLLDNCMIVFGSGIGDGDRHNHDNLPIALLGRGGGTVRSGRHVLYKKETPLNNLYLAMLDRMESSIDSLGDSNGKLELS